VATCLFYRLRHTKRKDELMGAVNFVASRGAGSVHPPLEPGYGNPTVSPITTITAIKTPTIAQRRPELSKCKAHPSAGTRLGRGALGLHAVDNRTNGRPNQVRGCP